MGTNVDDIVIAAETMELMEEEKSQLVYRPSYTHCSTSCSLLDLYAASHSI